MTHPFSLMALILALIAASAARADAHQLVLDGQVESRDGTRSATLHLFCEPAPDGGAIGVELWVPQAFTRKDFDYDDFEGPDAAARTRALSRLSVGGPGSHVEIIHTATGWYTGEDPDSFAFGLSQPSQEKGKLADLLRAVDAKTTQLVWLQRAFDGHTPALRATFALDAARAQQLRDTVAPCLGTTASTPAKRASK
ncbi:MAG: hypothetical protein ABI629_15370 [bacterium]